MRYFNDLLNDSWHNNDLLDYFLNFNNLGHLDHFFNNLLDWNFYFLNPINMSQDFNNLLFDVFNGLRNLDVVVDNLFNLDDLWLTNNNWISNLDNNWDLTFNDLDNWLFNNLLYSDDSFMDDWHLNNSLNFFWYLSNYLYYPLNNFLNFLDDITSNNLFHNYLNLIWFLNDISNLHYFLYYLRYFNNSLLSLDDNYWFLDNPIHNNVSNLNMVVNFFSSNDFSLSDYFLHYLLNLHDLWHADDLLNKFLNINWHLD